MKYKRHRGGADLPKVECINRKLNKWRVRWDYKPYINEDGEESGITFVEEEFLHKPTLQEMKELIFKYYNDDTDQRILSGFVWEDKHVWLSTENQFNFKAAYDLALQSEGHSLPVKFKLGEDDEGNPVYHVFSDIADFTDFYTKAIEYINQCINNGWAEKDSVDWNEYIV